MGDRVCEFPGCSKAYLAKGLCSTHYQRQYAKTRICSFDGCGRYHAAKGLCAAHWKQRYERGQELTPVARRDDTTRMCKGPGCRRLQSADLCGTHRAQMRKHGKLSPIRTRGNRYVRKDGYAMLYMPDHPNATKSGDIREHVYVMAEHMGRALVAGENVHHLNGIRDDNRISNLELWNTHQPQGQRIPDKLAYALELLALYEPTWYNAIEEVRHATSK